jgi:RNA polymerase sigma factor (sigma-70 family)
MPIARSDKGMEDLARRMHASEENAFLEFSREFGPRIKAFFVSRGLSVSDAEDLSVTCVTDISINIHKYTSVREGGFIAWIFTVAYNRLIDWRRRQKRITEPLSETLEAPSEINTLEHNLDIVLAVREALTNLPERDQMVILLRDLDGEYSYAAIGEQLGMTTEASRVCHHRALKKLREILEKDHRITGWLKQESHYEQSARLQQ